MSQTEKEKTVHAKRMDILADKMAEAIKERAANGETAEELAHAFGMALAKVKKILEPS